MRDSRNRRKEGTGVRAGRRRRVRGWGGRLARGRRRHTLLHPQEQVFTATITGWRNQQMAGRLAFATVERRERVVRAFAGHSQSYPWLWTAQLIDKWMTDLRAGRGVRASTWRGYQIALRLFCSYATDSAYGWPAECDQRFGTHPVRVFLRWAQRSGHAPRLQQVPNPGRTRVTPISQHRRLSWTRRILTDDTIALRTRVAAGLLLLFTQPITRIVTLTIDDVLYGQDHGQEGRLKGGQDVYRRLRDPPTLVPEPLAGLLLELVNGRANMNTARNPDSRWLFPGGRAGQSLTPGALRQRFQALGLPTIPARTAALSQLVLQANAPLVAAAALGYQSGTAEQHRAVAGGTWSQYVVSRRDDKQADSRPAAAP